MYKRTLAMLAATAAVAATATGGAAQAQSYGPRPAYASAGYDDGCARRPFTLLGANAGVTVLGIDVGASAGLHVGLHDRCGGGRPTGYTPQPAAYAPPQPYGPAPGYGEAPPAYPQAPYGAGGYGYAYAGQAAYGYRSPCGC